MKTLAQALNIVWNNPPTARFGPRAVHSLGGWWPWDKQENRLVEDEELLAMTAKQLKQELKKS